MYEKWHVFEVMTKGAFCARPEMTLEELTLELIERQIHGAPVIDEDDKLVGVISLTDVAASLLNKTGAKKTVHSVMSLRVFRIDQSANLVTAAREFKKRGVHRLIATHNDKVVGILSATDLIDPFLERLGGHTQNL
jgi:predicted transcriptional regulator